MTSTKPLIFGYIRAHALMTDDELAGMKAKLARFADIEGYALGTVYVEGWETGSAALSALVDEVRKLEATAVVVPTRYHLAGYDTPAAVQTQFEQRTGARVLVADATDRPRAAGPVQ